jgi:SAM-dependent methyltransferase
MAKAKPLRLDIGSGRFPKKGFVTVDRYEVADIEADMWEIPLEDDSVEEISCSAAMEHIPFMKVAPTLKEFYRILRPGGRLTVEVPDHDYVAKYWLNGQDRGWALVMMYGIQTHPGEFHRCCWNVQGLAGDLQFSGFVLDSMHTMWNYQQQTLRARCHKPAHGEKKINYDVKALHTDTSEAMEKSAKRDKKK